LKTSNIFTAFEGSFVSDLIKGLTGIG